MEMDRHFVSSPSHSSISEASLLLRQDILRQARPLLAKLQAGDLAAYREFGRLLQQLPEEAKHHPESFARRFPRQRKLVWEKLAPTSQTQYAKIFQTMQRTLQDLHVQETPDNVLAYVLWFALHRSEGSYKQIRAAIRSLYDRHMRMHPDEAPSVRRYLDDLDALPERCEIRRAAQEIGLAIVASTTTTRHVERRQTDRRGKEYHRMVLELERGNPRISLAYRLAAVTGARISELCTLRLWRDKSGQLWIGHHNAKSKATHEVARRVLPDMGEVNCATIEAFMDGMTSCAPLKGLTPNAIDKAIRKARQRLGIQGEAALGIHALRSAYATVQRERIRTQAHVMNAATCRLLLDALDRGWQDVIGAWETHALRPEETSNDDEEVSPEELAFLQREVYERCLAQMLGHANIRTTRGYGR